MLEAILAITSSRHCPTSEMVKAAMSMITCAFSIVKMSLNIVIPNSLRFVSLVLIVVYPCVLSSLSPRGCQPHWTSLAALFWFEVS